MDEPRVEVGPRQRAFKVSFVTTGGHRGPPLQFVPNNKFTPGNVLQLLRTCS